MKISRAQAAAELEQARTQSRTAVEESTDSLNKLKAACDTELTYQAPKAQQFGRKKK